MRRYSLLMSVIVLFAYCNTPVTKEQSKKEEPILEKFNKKELKISKRKKFGNINSLKGEFTVIPISKLASSKKVNVEIEETEYNTYYRSKSAERNEKILSIKIKLSASRKWNDSKGDFLPEFRVYKLTNDSDSLTNDDLLFLNNMDINFYYKPKTSYYVLEQYFNYNETGTFIIHCSLSEADLKRRLIVTVHTDKTEGFNKENILAILN